MELVEIIFRIGGVFLFWWFISSLFRKGSSATKAAVKSVKSEKTFKEEYDDQEYELGPLECKASDVNYKCDSGKVLKGLNLQIRGVINTSETTQNLVVVASFFDITDKDDFNKPILSSVTDLRELNSATMMLRTPFDNVEPHAGFIKWANMFDIYPDFMIGQKKGKRKIKAFFRVIPKNELSIKSINYGLHTDGLVIFSSAEFVFDFSLKEIGYEEARKNYFKIRAAFVEFGVLMAFADGNLDASEGNTIKDWIEYQIHIADEDKKDELKTLLNKALKDSFESAKSGELILETQLKKFKKITTDASSFGLVEFIMGVSGADGEMSSAELKVANSIAKALKISMDDMKSITDKTLLKTDQEMKSEGDLENLLGITDDMTKPQIKKLLNDEFKKWNGRIQALEDGDEKDKAQNMLNIIADARKKHG